MPSALSVDLAKSLLNHVFGATVYNPLATIHAAIFTTNPTDYTTGAGAVQPAGVPRVAIANNATNFPNASSSGNITTKPCGIAVDFGVAPSTLTIVGFGLYSAATDGSWIGGASLAVPVVISSGSNISFETGALMLRLNTAATGGLSAYLCRKLLDLAFGAVSYAPPTDIYGAYFTTAPNYASGAGAVEPSVGSSYSRVARSNNATNFPNATGTAIANKTCAVDVTFANPTASQGDAIAGGFYDAATAGNLLWSGSFPAPSTIAPPTNNVRFSANSLIIGVQAA